MATTEKFCLKWNDFEANIGVAFRELRDDKDFFDIKLQECVGIVDSTITSTT